MASSKAATPEEYLAELPPERREVVAAVRDVVLRHLPEGYQEAMSWGMLSYEVPLERCPDTYNGKPLSYAALAAQKHYYSLYLMNASEGTEQEEKLRRAFEEAGLKLDMGKCCLRFRKLEGLPLDAIGEVIASTPVEEMIEYYETCRRR